MKSEDFISSSNGGLALPRTKVRDRIALANFNDLVNWSVKNTDTKNMALSTKHIRGTSSIIFDKDDTSANDTEAAIQNSPNDAIDISRILPDENILAIFYISSLASVVNAFVRIGTNSSNYNQWTWPSALLKANQWNSLTKSISECDFIDAGAGWNQANVSYVQLGVTFKLQSDTLTAIRFDNLCLIGK